MTRTRFVAAAAMLTALGLAGCAPAYEGVSPEEFAETTCRTYDATMKLDAANEEIQDDPVFDSDAAEDRDDQVAFVLDAADSTTDHYRTALEEARTTIPAVRDGDEVAEAFVTFYGERLAAAEEQFAHLDELPEDLIGRDIGWTASDLFFEVSLAGDFPFYDVDDQAVIEAIVADPSCADYVELRSW